jgi:hypothetical protein
MKTCYRIVVLVMDVATLYSPKFTSHIRIDQYAVKSKRVLTDAKLIFLLLNKVLKWPKFENCKIHCDSWDMGLYFNSLSYRSKDDSYGATQLRTVSLTRWYRLFHLRSPTTDNELSPTANSRDRGMSRICQC